MSTIYSLYGGDIKLSFEPARHIYKLVEENGKEKNESLISVTGATSVIDKPALVWWSSRQAVEYVKSQWLAGASYDEIQIQKICDDAYRAHNRISKEAASIGTMVHEFAEKYAKWHACGDNQKPELPINEIAQRCCFKFLDWVKKRKVNFIATERKVYSRRHKYVGTEDVIIGTVGGVRAVVDYKTANGIWDEYLFQLAAYYNAIVEETNYLIGTGYELEHEFPKEQWIVTFGKDDGEFIEHQIPKRDFSKNFRAFLGALAVKKRLKEVSKSKKEEKEIA